MLKTNKPMVVKIGSLVEKLWSFYYQKRHFWQQYIQERHQWENCLKEHSQKLTPYLFQNYVPLYLKLYWKQKNVANINFWCFIKLKDWAFQQKKNEIFWLTWSKVIPLTSKQEIAADNGMQLTYPSHLE